MFRRFDPAQGLRTLSFLILFVVPGLYIGEILPLWVLPLAVALSIAAAYALDRMRLRTLPAILCALAGATVFFIFLYVITRAIGSNYVSTAFLRLSLAYWIPVVSCSMTVTATLAWRRTLVWRKIEPLATLALFAALFWSQGKHTITVFPHPLYLASLASAMILVTLARMTLTLEVRRRGWPALAAFAPFLTIVVFFIMAAFNALSVSNNGGLIQPTLFRFDFSPYLSLQNEIKLNDKLVLIVRTAEENSTTLLRRIYLAGWNPEKGFFEDDPPGERRQITQVPGRPQAVSHDVFELRSPTEQEYFIVNFDPSSLIAMDYPVAITPYRIWDSTAFNGAYAVTSEIIGFIPFELFDCPAPSGNPDEGMTRKTLDYYTAIDPKTAALVGEIARKHIENVPGYYDKIQALTAYLRDGDFRYSLKPGVAPDGNQLRYFLEDSKKGYCTYFAFSLCLMLRSVGIPARISAGFFLKPDSGALGYYPVRANMAHAWVEVFFPRYGWIAFDPTSNELAEGENLEIDMNPGGDEFLNLLSEIIDRRNELTAENRATASQGSLASLMKALSSFVSKHSRPGILALLCAALAIPGLRRLYRYLVMTRSTNARKAVLFAAAEMYRALARKGIKRNRGESRTDFTGRVSDTEVSKLFSLEQRARYAPEIPSSSREQALALLKSIKRRYRKRRPFSAKSWLLLVFLAFALRSPSAQEGKAAEDMLLAQANTAIQAENWESAITILTNGIRSYPRNPFFHYTLGNLYTDQRLYAAARKELLAARALDYPDIELYSRLSEVSSLLNLDEEALSFITKFLAERPEDLIAWSNYGWLCYKTNRLDEGIKKLHETLAKYGPDGNLYVGLGNLYTAAFDYPNAKKYYTLAIENAERLNQLYPASIHYYNRSILEETFYHFDDAYRDTVLSLEATPRSSGYLMQGELELRRHSFKAAFEQYLKAFSIDSTPLASMGLADTLIQAGYPTQAAQYMDSIERKKDLSWISNYGTTPDQYRADIYKTRMEISRFARNLEKRKVINSLSTFISKRWHIARLNIAFWYNDAMNRVLTAKVARYYETSEQYIRHRAGDGFRVNSFYYQAFNSWHGIAAPYLSRAKAIETGRIPAALPSYKYEEALIHRDMGLLEDAIESLDPEWERQFLSKALGERLSGFPWLDTENRNAFSSRLYAIHPAAFIIHDLSLPVSFTRGGTETKRDNRITRKLERLFRQAGFEKDTSAPYAIDFSVSDSTLSVSLVDKNNYRTSYSQVINISTGAPLDLYDFVNKFSTKVFQTDIGLP
jgi:transglutaminase-like putative cysteine protease/tetratricopeptide (TPR) repeat protein